MPSNDIPNQEQVKKAPMLKPQIENKDIPANEIKLVQQAFNYIQQHRPQLDRENGARNNPIMEEHHRGDVVDPEHDHRLKKNKDREDEERKEKEEQEARQRAEEMKRNQEKLEEIKKLNETKRIANKIISFDPSNQLKGPGNFNMPPGAKIPARPAPTPILKPPVKQRPSAMPQGTTPFSPEEMALRNHPVHGPAVQKLLGPKPATPELLNKVRDNLQRKQMTMASLEEKNDIHLMLSQVANLLLKSGILK